MANQTLERANDYLMPNYGQMSIEIVSGKGCVVRVRDESEEERECLDFLSGLGVNNLGHCHPAVVDVIARQAEKLMHVSNLYATGPMARLAEFLVTMSGCRNGKVFFCNSGTEANEAAGKLARIWAHENFGPGKNRIIAFTNSFHGRTMFSISMTGQSKMQDKFAPIVPNIDFVNLNDIEGLRKAVSDDVCAVIFEVIQAEGGINIMSLEFYQELYELSNKHNFLRIVDEVQTGMGRTGELFAHWNYSDNPDITPDMITLAKALGGGLPVGAVIAKDNVGKFMLPGSHAATFGGNPVVAAAGLAVMETICNDGLLRRVKENGWMFFEKLNGLREKYPQKIRDVRGLGFMLGVELASGFSAGDAVKAMFKEGILVGTAGAQVVRFLPPLITGNVHIYYVLEKFEEVIKGL